MIMIPTLCVCVCASVCVCVCVMLLWGSDLSPSKVKVCFFVSSGALVSFVSFCHRAVCFAFSHLSNIIPFPSHSIYPLILCLSCTLLTPFQLFAPFLFSLQPSIDIQTCGFILEPPLLSFPPLVCLSAQLHHSELSLQRCTIIICIYKNSKVSCQFVK